MWTGAATVTSTSGYFGSRRAAGRLLLSKRNAHNLDLVLSDAANLFRIAYNATNKRLFSFSGEQITHAAQLADEHVVLMTIGNEKLHAKDLELDPQGLLLLLSKNYAYILFIFLFDLSCLFF